MTDLVLIANPGDSTITSFRLADERLVPLASNVAPGPSSTFAIDLERDLVYAGCKPGAGTETPLIVTFALDRQAGTLTEVSRVAAIGNPTYLELAAGGTVLLAAYYHQGEGHAYPVADGVVGPSSASLAYPNVHCVRATDDGHVYFVALGADLIAQYRLDGVRLVPLDPPTVAAPAGSGPRHLVFSADGATAWCITEFSGEVLAFDRTGGGLVPRESLSIVDPAAGLRHSHAGADPRAEGLIWGADVWPARPHYLLASERNASTVASVSLDGGRLGRVVALRPTEAQPRGFAVAPDGVHVVAVGELSTIAALYRLGADGVLIDLDRVETGRGANWVRIIEGRA